jgi:hypothetical protein
VQTPGDNIFYFGERRNNLQPCYRATLLLADRVLTARWKRCVPLCMKNAKIFLSIPFFEMHEREHTIHNVDFLRQLLRWVWKILWLFY